MKALPIILLLFLLFFETSHAAVSGGGNSDFLSLSPPFVVNISDGEKSQFLQITSEVRLTDPEMGSVVQHHMALIRHVLIMLFSEQTSESVRSLEGKERLREETLEALQYALEEETGDTLVRNIYFTGFIIQ